MNPEGRPEDAREDLRHRRTARPRRGIAAIVYRNGRRRGTLQLPAGAIVEVPEPDRRVEAPERPGPCVGVTAAGLPATAGEVCLGLVVDFLDRTGVYLLPSDEVAVVYGARSEPTG